MRIPQSILLLAGAVASVLARDAAVSSKIRCITAMGTKSVQYVRTTTLPSTSTIHLCDVTTTSFVPATVTAKQRTRTKTQTTSVTVTVTESTVTDTYTSTSTTTELDTETANVVETDTETDTTSTTTTSTSTIPAPSGFVPVSDTQTNGFPSRKRRNGNKKKPVAHHKDTHNPSPSYGILAKSQFPQSVRCQKTITEQKTVTRTATEKGCTRTIKPKPFTRTITKTMTSTSTEVPHASTTETTTETTTTTTTTTNTQTTTQTTTQTNTATATATAYEACSSDNIISSYNGQSIVNAYNNNNGQVGGGSIYDDASASSAEDCCVLCINTSGCQGSYFLSGRCVLLHNASRSCSGQSSGPIRFVTGNGGSFAVSNGLCGYNQYGTQ